MKALIVDDSPYMRTQLRNLADDMGYDTEQAEDGRDALHTLEEDDIGLVILDIVMDDMDGLTFLKELQEHEDRPAVVVVSALLDDDIRGDARELGVEHFVDKPFEEDDLKAIIREAVEG